MLSHMDEGVNSKRLFDRYIGIDYSGAEVPNSGLKGIRVYMADPANPPLEAPPPPSLRKYWTRRDLAEWLASLLGDGIPTLVGIDHAFSFPLKYFEKHRLPLDWPAFLDDFCRHWPTDEDNVYVDFIRDGVEGNGAARSGHRRWRRLTEMGTGAKSVFLFDVIGSVAKSTHAGLPWLRYMRRQLDERLHFWPFDGWTPPAGRSVIAEVYPSLWRKDYARDARDPDQHDAYVVAAWMQRVDGEGSLPGFFHPVLSPAEREIARIEGWILGLQRAAPHALTPVKRSKGTGKAASTRLGEAFQYAAEFHREQKRKGTETPYISHLMAVAGIVLENGGDEDTAIAALLHDVIEDGGGDAARKEIRRRFGKRVADIVDECTDAETVPKLPWRERKEIYVAHLRHASPQARLVSAADKLHNARAILADYRVVGEALWTRFNADRDGVLWYYNAIVAAFREGGATPLVEELERVVKELTRLVKERNG